MNYLLRAMGLWIWGLIAIAISVSLVSISYRTISAYHQHYAFDASSPDAGSSAELPMPRVASETAARGSRPPFISKIIGKDMSAAQKAMQNGQWSEALRNLGAAKSKSPLTSYDVKTIEEFTGVTNIRLKDFKAAQTAYEAALATGVYKAEELVRIFRLLFQLAALNRQDTVAIEYGTQTAEYGVASANDLLIMSQLYYQQKDCKNSGIWGDKAIAAFEEAGQPPKEVLYQLKLQCASDASDANAMKTLLYDLVRLTNKTSYWNNLLRLERQDERDDHNTLMIYRVMFDTHSMNADTDYIEMAQLLGDAGLPGEAQTVLQKALASGVLKEEHKERAMRLLNALQARAEADENGLPGFDAQAGKDPAGALDVKVGEVYFGAGDYRRAVSAIGRGVAKGQAGQLDDAYVLMGRSLAAERDPAGAKQAFAKLKSLPNISPRVLKLWNLYADMIPETVSESL
jgi:hypothetical protein